MDNLPNEDVAIAMNASSAAHVGRFLPAQLGGFPTDTRPYAIPGLSTALMASAMPYFHPEWVSCNETEQIKGMLESRGYSVTREPLQLKHFRELHKYGVLLIETHGVWLESSNFKDITVCKNLVNMRRAQLRGAGIALRVADHDVNSRRTGGETPRRHRHWTADTAQRADALVVNGVPVQTVTKQYYAVTSLFLRQHVTEPYTDGMLVMVNACKAFHNKDQARSARSSSRNRAVRSSSPGTRSSATSMPPRGAQPVSAYDGLERETGAQRHPAAQEAHAADRRGGRPGLGAGLSRPSRPGHGPDRATSTRRAAVTEIGDMSQSLNLLLMPYAMEWNGPSPTDPKVRLGLLATDNATVTIGGNSVTATPEMLCCTASWFLSDSPNLYGNIMPWYFSR